MHALDLPGVSSCPECWSSNVVPTEVSGKGTVYLLVVLHQGRPLAGTDYSAPVPVAGVELVEQKALRYVAPIVNCEPGDVRLEMPVELTWVDRDGAPAPAFQPA